MQRLRTFFASQRMNNLLFGVFSHFLDGFVRASDRHFLSCCKCSLSVHAHQFQPRTLSRKGIAAEREGDANT